MARGPESLLHKKVKENLPRAIITRLESRVGLGIPDCLVGLIDNRFVMIELKVVKSGKKVKLSPHQIAFNLRHGMADLPAFILVLYQRPNEARLLLYHGRQAQDLIATGIDTEPLDEWPYDSVNWEALREQLVSV